MQQLDRRNFLTRVVSLAPAALLTPGIGWASTTLAGEPIPALVVNEFVKVAHSDFDRAKTLLAEYPHLINAAWDWGDGDFETAIGAAGHMGHHDFAQFLLENGARADIFVLTMLGETALVKPMLKKYPNLLRAIGPHGFTLLHHAEKGGAPAEELLKFLKKQGLTEKNVKYFNK